MPRSRPGAGEWAYRLLAPVAVALVWLLARVRVLGAEHVPRSGAVLLSANHVSHLDPLVLAVVLYRLGRRARYLAAAELWAVPRVGWLLRATKMIPVERGAGPERMVEDTLPALDAGEAVLVYPEGTIPQPGKSPPARPGAGLLALCADAPVVPVATWGLGRTQAGRLRLRRPVAVAFGPALQLTAWDGRRDRAAQLEVAEAMLAAVRALLPAAERAAQPGPRSAGP